MQEASRGALIGRMEIVRAGAKVMEFCSICALLRCRTKPDYCPANSAFPAEMVRPEEGSQKVRLSNAADIYLNRMSYVIPPDREECTAVWHVKIHQGIQA